MKRKLKLHRDTVRNLGVIEGVEGAGLTGINTLCAGACPTQIGSCTGTCVFPCTGTLSPTACVPRACTF